MFQKFRQALSTIFSPFNYRRLFLIGLVILIMVLIGLAGLFYIHQRKERHNNFDAASLCLYDGTSNGLVVLVDQTASINQKQADSVLRRVKKIAADEVEQFGRLTIYTMTRDNQVQKIGFVCNPGNLAQVQDSWATSLNMSKQQLVNYYKSRLTDLTQQTTAAMVNKPAANQSKIIEAIAQTITLYKTPTNQTAGATDASNAAADKSGGAKILPDATALDMLIVFSDMKEHRPDFSLRTATAKNTPSVLDFWAKNPALKLDLAGTAVGVYYFKDKADKKTKTSSKDKKNSKKKKTTTASDNPDDNNDTADSTDNNGKGNSTKKTASNPKLRKFWEDYWQSQGATLQWYRNIDN